MRGASPPAPWAPVSCCVWVAETGQSGAGAGAQQVPTHLGPQSSTAWHRCWNMFLCPAASPVWQGCKPWN